jgi:hypothetical protein
MGDQVSNPYKTTKKVIGLYTFSVLLLDKWEMEGF